MGSRAAAPSLDFFFDLDFLVFFGRALVFVVSTLLYTIAILVWGVAIKLTARPPAR